MTNDPADNDDLLDHVGLDRRRFVKRLVAGSAFAVPVVSSFSMSGVNAVFAQDTNVSGGPSVGAGDTTNTTEGTTDGGTSNTDGGVSNTDGGVSNTDGGVSNTDGATGNITLN